VKLLVVDRTLGSGQAPVWRSERVGSMPCWPVLMTPASLLRLSA